MSETASLQQLGSLTPLDLHFAAFIDRIAGEQAHPMVRLAAALVSSYTGNGHVCIDLAALAEQPLLPGETEVRGPELRQWQRQLAAATNVVGRPGDFKPLVLDRQNRLYLHRYWTYEHELALALAVRGQRSADVDGERLRSALTRLFPETATTDWQRVAAFAAVTGSLTIISGGPGTGKTHTVARILALLQELATEPLEIALAAPTGKAAMRMRDALDNALEDPQRPLPISEEIRACLPREAGTIHRLLGARPNSPYFRHDHHNRLPADVVIVDEASMVDLPLLSKLVAAMAESARLILLGDRDQLASVQAGAVLGDLCGHGAALLFSAQFRAQYAATGAPPLPDEFADQAVAGMQDRVVQLQASYRFPTDRGIGAVAKAVNAGDAQTAIEVLRTDRSDALRLTPLPAPGALPAALAAAVDDGYRPYLSESDPEAMLAAFESFRVLAAIRTGPYGVSELNALIYRELLAAGLIRSKATWYHGRPVMITRNDYNLHLFNGDIGIAVRVADSEADVAPIKVYFRGRDGAMREPLSPFRLPPHETVFAMTVHKSQGSEFDRIALILPDEPYPLLTRELLYTGITRARSHVDLWASETVLAETIRRRITRTSGLRDAVWGGL